MAADLIGSPDIQQTFVHDLESFFWVLLWIVLTQVKTSWSNFKCSEFLDTTFSSRIYGDIGSTSKLWFLKSIVTAKDFQIPGNLTLTDLVLGLKTVVSSRYEIQPSNEIRTYDPDRVDGEDVEAEKRYRADVEKYQFRSTFMDDHSKMLKAFSHILKDDKFWPEDDKASPWRFVPSTEQASASQSGTKRSRSVYEEGVSSSSKRRQA